MDLRLPSCLPVSNISSPTDYTYIVGCLCPAQLGSLTRDYLVRFNLPACLTKRCVTKRCEAPRRGTAGLNAGYTAATVVLRIHSIVYQGLQIAITVAWGRMPLLPATFPRQASRTIDRQFLVCVGNNNSLSRARTSHTLLSAPLLDSHRLGLWLCPCPESRRQVPSLPWPSHLEEGAGHALNCRVTAPNPYTR